MKLETFFEKFDQFADAPDAVAKMRELVLQLAFSGGFSGTPPDDDGVPRGWEKRTVESIASSITPGFACSRSHQVKNGHVHLRTHNISTLGTLNFEPFHSGCCFRPIQVTIRTTAEISAIA